MPALTHPAETVVPALPSLRFEVRRGGTNSPHKRAQLYNRFRMDHSNRRRTAARSRNFAGLLPTERHAVLRHSRQGSGVPDGPR